MGNATLTTDYSYDAEGNQTGMTDAEGGRQAMIYDALGRLTAVTDKTGHTWSFTYDADGNQTSVTDPLGGVVRYTYDSLDQLKTVTEDDGRTTAYTYDGMGRVTRMEYPHGWVEEYEYDSMGQLLRVTDIDPTEKDMKQQKHVYEYDDCGNMTYEYMRGNGTGEATVENFYTYDELHRITHVQENYGNTWRDYVYDSLGNLTYESNSNNVAYDYILNNLNQITEKKYSGGKERTVYTYDGRGNLVLEEYAKNNGNGNRTTVGEYTYDETNRMVLGVNSGGESSAYLYNGLGALVENTWVIAKNSYGYHDVSADEAEGQSVDAGIMPLSNGNGNGHGNGQGNGNGSGDKPTGSLVTNFSTVVKQFAVDYTTATFEPLMEHEVNGLDYRYVYGNDRLSVNITGVETSSGNLIENGNQIRLYYHMDFLGTTDYLTSPVSLKVTSWTHYNEWGEITHNAVLKTGQRELDLVKRYATHDYDAVLGLYYAKARFYDAENRRFTAVDPVKGNIAEPLTMVQYIYVLDNPLVWVDPLGLWTASLDISGYISAGWRAGVGVSIVFDNHGNIGIALNAAIGAGTPGVGAGVTSTFTNAKTISGLAGLGLSIGGSILGWGLDFSFGISDEGKLITGVALPAGQILGALAKANKLTGLLSAVNGAIGNKLPTLTAAGNAAELHVTASFTKVITVAALAPFYNVIRSYFKQIICKFTQTALKYTLGVSL